MPSDPVHRTVFPVRYHESDQMGVVHHAVYVQYFELGRTEAMRDKGLDYAELERSGTQLAVIDVGLHYHSPARFGDCVVVETRVTKVERVRVHLEYRVLREEPGAEALLCSGHTVLASVDPTLRPVRLPGEVRSMFQQMLPGGA